MVEEGLLGGGVLHLGHLAQVRDVEALARRVVEQIAEGSERAENESQRSVGLDLANAVAQILKRLGNLLSVCVRSK